MIKFKVCPYCGAKNDPTVFDCSSCGGDLSSVKITDEETLEATEKAREEKTAAPKYVRICSECGHANSAVARVCTRCGEDISDIIPTEETSPDKKKTSHALFSLSGDFAYEISDKSAEVGREAEMKEYLFSHSFVSRRHCRFTCENGTLYVEDLGSSNGTFVNNQRIKERTALKEGDEIGIGGCVRNEKRQDQAAYFVVRMTPCTLQESCTR